MSASRRFWFFLARTLGRTVHELQRSMSAREFQEWQEYYKLEPFGDDWLQTGTVAAVMANSNPFNKRRYRPEQFIPKVRQRQTPEQIESLMNQWARIHNRNVAKRQGEI